MEYYSTIFLANLHQFSIAFDAIESDLMIDNKTKEVYDNLYFRNGMIVLIRKCRLIAQWIKYSKYLLKTKNLLRNL